MTKNQKRLTVRRSVNYNPGSPAGKIATRLCGALVLLFVAIFAFTHQRTYVFGERAFMCDRARACWDTETGFCDAAGNRITGRIEMTGCLSAEMREVIFVTDGLVDRRRNYFHGRFYGEIHFDRTLNLRGDLVKSTSHWPNGRLRNIRRQDGIFLLIRTYSPEGDLVAEKFEAWTNAGNASRAVYHRTSLGRPVNEDDAGFWLEGPVFTLHGYVFAAPVVSEDGSTYLPMPQDRVSGELRIYNEMGNLFKSIQLEDGIVNGFKRTYHWEHPFGGGRMRMVTSELFDHGVLRMRRTESTPIGFGSGESMFWYDTLYQHIFPDEQRKNIYIFEGTTVKVSCEGRWETISSWNAAEISALGYTPRCPFEG